MSSIPDKPADVQEEYEEYDDEEECEDEEGYRSMVCEYMVLALTVFAWNAVLLFLLSDMKPSMGVRFYVATLSRVTDLAGLGFLALGLVLLCVFYIMDWVSWRPLCKTATGLVIFGTMFLGICLNAWLPGAPMLLVVFTLPAVIRLTSSCFNTSNHFKQHFIAGSITLVFAFLLLGCWVLWVFVGEHSVPLPSWPSPMAAERQDVQMMYSAVFPTRALNYTEDCYNHNATQFGNESQAIVKACGTAAAFLYSAWVYPLVAFFAHLVWSALFFVTGAYMRDTKEGGAIEKTEHLLLLGVSLLALLITGMYAATNIKGYDIELGRLLLFSFVVGVATIAGWLYVQLGENFEEKDADTTLCEASQEELNKALEKTGMKQWLSDVAQSDWVCAVFVGGLNLLIPIYLVMAWARDKFREYRDGTDSSETDEEAKVSHFGRISGMLAKWDWASVLFKVCLLGDAFFLMVVVATKITSIFLSWLRNFLSANLAFSWMVLAAFIIAVLLYVLLPPLPGVAVHLFCGILVLGQVNDTESISFAVGCLIATMLALMAKLAGSALQYALGYCFGQNLFIQQQIGVDSVFIRATEEILRRPGLDPGKVAILVGGPDWPTSALCGVLKVNLCQILIGTVPVLFIVLPTVMAAAFKTLVIYGQPSIYRSLSSICMILTIIVQPLSGLFATQAILRVLGDKGEELKKPRPEHRAVEQLSALQAKKNEAYRKVTDWNTLGCFRKTLIILATLLVLISCWTFFLAGALCFRPFEVSNEIGDSFEKGGLEGDPLNLVLAPLGWLSLPIYFVSVFLQLAFYCITSEDAREEFGYDEDDQENEDQQDQEE